MSPMWADSLFPEKEHAGGEFLQVRGRGEKGNRQRHACIHRDVCLECKTTQTGTEGEREASRLTKTQDGQKHQNVERNREGGEGDKGLCLAMEKPCLDTLPSIPSRPGPSSMIGCR